jgi:hypothetical protein
MSEIQKVYSPKKLSDLVSLPNLSDDTVVLASNNNQTGKLTLLGLRQYLNVDSIDTDFAGVLASIGTLNENVAQNTADIEGLETVSATKLGYSIVTGNTVVNSPAGDIAFNVNGNQALNVTSSGVGYGINNVKDLVGDVNPEGVISANKGSTYRNYNGSGGQTLWHKVQGNDANGWLPVSSSVGVNVKDFGAKGDGVTDDTVAIQAALTFGAGNTIYFPKGNYICSNTLILPDATTLIGAGVGHWRPGTFNDLDEYTLDHGTNLVFVGTGPKTYTMDFVTDMRCSGHVFTNPEIEYTLDSEFSLTNFTNNDASEVTSATLKPFSVAIFSNSRNGNILKNMRVVLNNPSVGEQYGVGNYRSVSSLSWGDNWDVGIFSSSTRAFETHNVQVVGYWRIAALLLSPVDYGSEGLSGLSEMCKFYDSIFQGLRGVSLRSGDQWPIVSKTSNSVTTRWTGSHTFPLSGNIRIDGSIYSYTGLTYSAAGPILTFTGISDTSSVVAGQSLIERTSTQGLANTTFYGCDITDLSHSSRILEYNPEFTLDARQPGSALEISGQDLRGINFIGCSFYVNGPVLGHLGRARNINFISCHFETKTNNSAVSTNSGILGSAWLAGGDQSNSDNYPLTRTDDVRFIDTIADDPRIDRSPLIPSSSGSRLKDCGFFRPNQYVDTSYPTNSYPNQWQKNYSTGTWGVQSSTGVPRLVVHDTHVQSASDFRVSNSANRLQLEQTDAPVNEKVWEFTNTNSSDGTLILRTALDNFSPGNNAYTILRDTSNVVGQTWNLNSGLFSFEGGPIRLGSSGAPTVFTGSGTPEGVITAPIGSTYHRTDGGAGTSFYVKESGAGNTGWVAK